MTDNRHLSPETIEEGRAFIIDGERQAFYQWVEEKMPHLDPETIRSAIYSLMLSEGLPDYYTTNSNFWTQHYPPSTRNSIFTQLVDLYHKRLDENPDETRTLFDHLTGLTP